MSALEDLLGAGDAAKQLFVWGVLNQVVSALLAPYFTALQNKVLTNHPVVPLSPADAAHAVVRSYLDQGQGEAAAAASGVSAPDFAVLRDLAGNAPAPEQLVEALRRGLINRDGTGAGSTSFVQGIAETNLLDKWTGVIEGLAQIWPTPADIIDAMVKGQVTAEQGRADYVRVGGDPRWFDLLVNTNGNPPAPGELLGLAQRGIIPWSGTGPDATTFEQGFHEGRSKNKWEPVYRQLAAYWPTASEVTEWLRYGIVTDEQAAAQLAARGVGADDAARFIAYAHVNAIDDYRGLTEQAVLTMVAAGYTSDEQARVMLKALHKGDAAIDQLLRYADLQRSITVLANAVNRIGNLYQGRKITAATARQALVSLHLPAANIGPIIADWDAVASVNVRVLTAAEIADAWQYKVLTQAEATQELVNLGWTPFDAWVLLSNKHKAPLPDKPAQGPGMPLGAVAAGTT